MAKAKTPASGPAVTGSNKIQRRPFIAELMKLRAGALVVPGLGSATWDLSAAGDSAEYLYSWGGMGLAVPTALGLALAQPKKRIVVVTGDGELLMGIGCLGVVADQAPGNLSILVLDNESFGETGRQTGLTSSKTDLIAVARGFGIGNTMLVTEQGAVPELGEFLFKAPGPSFAVAKIALGHDPWSLPEKDGAVIAHRFRVAVGVAAP
jgi:thiamine pyrophosphate-dependent acetolactate synthase large subunit-like protein